MFPGSHWIPVGDGDPRALALYLRHYSARKNGATRYGAKNWNRFVGPAEDHIVLLTVRCDALFIWRKDKYRRDGQVGVNCSVFRNESDVLSSELILEAERWAWQKWPGERLFTFVDASAIRSTNPGYTYLKAGWRRLSDVTGKGLRILEKLPNAASY